MTTPAAKKPSDEQLQEVFTALVGNGLDFFARSAQELVKEQKFSIAHFATGIELLLKARLFHEHWRLIATDPHKCAWSSVKDGTVRTLQASDLCAVLTTATGTTLTQEGRAFKSVFDHRNRVLHWAPDGDLTTTVAEQCLAWHYLHELLTTQWRDLFGAFGVRIEQVDGLLRRHREYLEVRFRQIEQQLKETDDAGLLVVCPACEFRAGVVNDEGSGRVQSFMCQVCWYTGTAFRTDSGAFEHREGSDILNALDPTPILRPKEMMQYEPDRGHCGECLGLEATVAQDGDDYVCVECGVRFDASDSSTCEWCNLRWFGWDSEGSYYGGCEHCDGHGMGD